MSPLGGPITIIYDSAQPSTPPTPVLDPASDTGIKGDNITSDTSPFLDVAVSLSGFEANSARSLGRRMVGRQLFTRARVGGVHRGGPGAES